MVTVTRSIIDLTGQEIDGPENGEAPSPWVIDVQPDNMFLNHQKCYEVPHTASVKTCTNCMGAGMNRCWMCLGRGMVHYMNRDILVSFICLLIFQSNKHVVTFLSSVYLNQVNLFHL